MHVRYKLDNEGAEIGGARRWGTISGQSQGWSQMYR